MKFAWIHQHREAFDVMIMCSTFQVTRGGYYAWRKRPASARAARKQHLMRQIQHVHRHSHGIYGSPRIAAELADQGCRACVNTVAKYMQEAGIRSRIKRRFRISTTDSAHGCPVAPNRLERNFAAERGYQGKG